MIKKDELGKRLLAFQEMHNLPGLKTEESCRVFISKIMESQKSLRARLMLKPSVSIDPSKADFHPLKAILKIFEEKRFDEAVWLIFLTTHFGEDATESIRHFYGKFGKGCWNWQSVCENPDAVREWMLVNEEQVKSLKFGNHRKYRTNDPTKTNGTAEVIRSFVEWVNQKGQGSPYQALLNISQANTPENKFDKAYQEISLKQFGRTGKFDFLCLLGNLKILPVYPPHCYLVGSTGPKNGALKMLTGKSNGPVTNEIEEKIEQLQKHLGIPAEVMEDALCNWQKIQIC